MTPFFITAFFIFGVHATTRDGMIFHGIYNKLFKTLSGLIGQVKADKIFKPLFDCTPCMASFYGVFSFFILYSPLQVAYLPVWVFSLAGCNYIINRLFR